MQMLAFAMGTRTSVNAHPLPRRPKHLANEMLHLRVGQAIVDEQAILAICHDARFAQHPELLRNVGLGTPQDGLEVADARLVLPQLVKYVQPGVVR